MVIGFFVRIYDGVVEFLIVPIHRAFRETAKTENVVTSPVIDGRALQTRPAVDVAKRTRKRRISFLVILNMRRWFVLRWESVWSIGIIFVGK